jgi:hypothetical protein
MSAWYDKFFLAGMGLMTIGAIMALVAFAVMLKSR